MLSSLASAYYPSDPCSSIYSVLVSDFGLFITGLATPGLGQGAIQQMRIAAADMYPDQRKAEGVSYILMANTVGAMGGPILVASTSNYAEAVGMDPYSMPWLFTPVLAMISAVLIVLIRPDPREIAHNLGHYYSGLSSKSPSVGLEVTGGRILRLFSYYSIFVTLLVVSLAWANMSMMMSLVSVVLHNHGFPLASISISVAIHILGMFALSVPWEG